MQISDEVGVCFETLRRWCVADGQGTTRAMVPVHVVDDGGGGSVAVCSPSGYRIEGLSLPEAVAALRALG